MYTVNIVDNFEVKAGELTKQEYVDFVMNMAAQSYKKQYNAVDCEAGIQAACDAYNAALPQPAPEPAPVE